MQTNKRFTAAENKLAYAQSFSRLTTSHDPVRPHRIGPGGVLQSFVRHPSFVRHSPFVPHRQGAGRHRSRI